MSICSECRYKHGQHHPECPVDNEYPQPDPVNRPSHYQLFPGQEAIDVIRAALTDEEFAGYCKGNALKYRLRAGEKGDTQQDIDKSNWYRKRLTEAHNEHHSSSGG